jgi:two-component system sensor histidine kinase KdpD
MANISPGDSRAWRDYAVALAVTVLATLVALPLYQRVDLINLVMIYVLGTTLCSLRVGRAASAFNAALNVLALDYFYVPPAFSFEVEDTKYLFTFSVMLVVALVIANLMVTIRRSVEVASARERRTAVLYAMSRELAVATEAAAIAAVAMKHIGQVFRSKTLVLATDKTGQLVPVAPTAESFDAQIAAQVLSTAERADADGIYLPLCGSTRTIGVVLIRQRPAARTLSEEKNRLLENFAAQLALALERARLAEEAEAARLSAERTALRNTLLTSISHDLRTPLAAIAGAGSLIARPEYALNADRRSTLGLLIERKARDMSQLLSNVLDLMRMEYATGALRSDWHGIDDLVALALRGTEAKLTGRRLIVDLPADLPVVFVEATLIVQMLGNLLENAAKYTPAGTTITIGASAGSASVTLTVADNGPGFTAGDPELLFEKFERGHAESNVVGVGLGLAICRAVARLHGGDIHARTGSDGGARFDVVLPIGGETEELQVAELAS